MGLGVAVFGFTAVRWGLRCRTESGTTIIFTRFTSVVLGLAGIYVGWLAHLYLAVDQVDDFALGVEAVDVVAEDLADLLAVAGLAGSGELIKHCA